VGVVGDSRVPTMYASRRGDDVVERFAASIVRRIARSV